MPPSADIPSSIDVAVIGGGIAGLSAAFELQSRNVEFVLLESANRPGGLIGTEHQDGFTIDVAADSMLVQKPAALELCRELGLERRLVATNPPRTAFVLRNGRLHPLPERGVLGIPLEEETLAAWTLLSDAGKARLAREIDVPPRELDAPDESIASFMERRFGQEVARYIGQPLLAGIHAGDAHRLSIRALFPRLVEAETAHGSVLRAFRNAASQENPDGVFRSFLNGMGELVDALQAALPSGAACYNRTVTSVARTVSDTAARTPFVKGTTPLAEGRPKGPATFTVRMADGGTISARRVIVATPAYVTSKLVRDLDDGLADLCEEVPYVPAATVALAYRTDAAPLPLRGTGFVVPPGESGHRITAATWVSSKWPHRAPPDRILLRAFLGGALDQGALTLENDEIVRTAHEDLAAIVGLAAPPDWARVFRWEHANAQYEVGHLNRVAAIDERLAAIPGLFVTGSGFRGTGIPDCVADARAVAAIAASTLAD